MKRVFNWKLFFSNWSKDLKVVIMIVSLLMFFRLAMLIVFHDQRAESGSSLDYSLVFKRGLLFDLRIALLIVLPTALLAFFLSNNSGFKWLGKMRLIIGSSIIIATIVLGIGNIGFFAEYHEQYNKWIFGLFRNDFWEILKIIWATYPVIWILIGLVVLCTISLIMLLSWIKKEEIIANFIINLPYSLFWKLTIVLLVLPLFVLGLRGGAASKPLCREHIGVTTDTFLNKLVINPYFALYYTCSDKKHLNKAAGLEIFLKNKSIKEALVLLYPNFTGNSDEIDDWLKRKVVSSGEKNKPKHIFLIVLESQDSWPLMDEFSWLDLAPNLRELATKGKHIKSFVSASYTTRTTLSSIITGLPDASVFTNLQSSSQKPYSTAFAQPFKALGYQVNFFYGGHLSWQRLGELAQNQGFDNLYGREHIPLTANSYDSKVFDEELFDFILKTINRDISSINLIMTTSNHSPYPVNLKLKGCPQIISPENYANLFKSYTDPHIMGHLWYNDYCIGRFVKEAETRFAPALFVITGDHTSRRFFSSKPTLYEYKSVPLILYGSETFAKAALPDKVAGSHLDILPTLIEHIGPEGFEYYAMGSNLFNANRRQIGLGADTAITPDAIWSIGKKQPLESLTGNTSELSQIDTQYLDDLYNAFHGVAWWKIMKGSKF